MWWNRLARKNPYWAILTSLPDIDAPPDLDSFFRSGLMAVDREIEYLDKYNLCPHRKRAVDFGCGLGRLTRGLAEHFDSVIGVDISEEMIRLAKAHNAHPERVDFVHNIAPDLAVFPDEYFNFIYSDITLQHIHPEVAKCYIVEFIRILKPRGVASFQVPASIPPEPVEKLKFSTWPPTLLRRLLRYFSKRTEMLQRLYKPYMPMYSIPKDEVELLVMQNGGCVLGVHDNFSAGPAIESYHYWISRH